MSTNDSKTVSDEIDLGIGTPVVPDIGEKLYAQRIVSGIADRPADEQMTPGLLSAVRTLESVGAVSMGDAGPDDAEALDLCLRDFGLSAMTADEYLQVGIDELNASMLKACRAGVAFWAAQEVLKSNDSAAGVVGKNNEYASGVLVHFNEWIEGKGLVRPRVYECIRLAKFYARLPAGQRTKLLSVGKKQALLLASLPQNVIDASAESGRDLFDAADILTLSELREEVKKLKGREATLVVEVERRDSMIRRLQTRGPVSSYTAATEDLRAECLVHQAAGELAVGTLLRMYDDAAGQELACPERDLQIDHVWITLHAIAARALDAIHRIRSDGRAIDLPERVLGQHLSTPAEAERWLVEWTTLERRHEAEKQARQAARDEARPRGPGRPKKAQG